MTRTLLLGAALLAAPAALAQQHGGMDHGQTDHSRAGDGAMQGMGHGATDPDAMVALHARMMADPEVHARIMADPETRALMAETMPAMDHSGMDHSQMSGMDHSQMQGMDHSGMAMDAGARVTMMAQMHEQMAAMSPAERADFLARLQAAHVRLMADPAVHQRMMADPEMRRMMGSMPGMDHGSMDHSQMQGMDRSPMDHSWMDRSGTASGAMQGTDHGQMTGMDHSQVGGADHAAGVALQRRNAGAVRIGDERPATPTVGPEAFAASETADRFHAALATGDRAAMEALLAPNAVVLAGGDHYARAEYLGGPFARTTALASAAPKPLYRRTGVAGDAAWVASTHRVGGVERAELLVMERTPDGWRVAAVHWSSAGN